MKKIPASLKTETFGHYAQQAISKHFKKSTKPESAVLKDEDPEPLHEMRVGMRRLRTAIEVFGPALELPKAASVKRIRKIARELGTVRDLDVMKVELKSLCKTELKEAERLKLDAILEKLSHQRSHGFVHLEKTLNGSRYRKFKRSLQNWLKEPTYKELADLPILAVLPDLLLPLISQLLLHPGWLMATNNDTGNLKVDKIDPKNLNQQLDQQGEILHDLRKQMKRLRYQTELFADFYGPDYVAQSQDFQTVQKVLGEVQDSLVLGEYLSSQIETDLEKGLPTLATEMQQTRARIWQVWQPIQERYLDPEFRQTLRAQILAPASLSSGSPVVSSVP